MKEDSENQPNVEEIFTEIYKKGSWKGAVPSGPGSSLKATELVRPRLMTLFARFEIRTLCDAPCGDGSWIFEITRELTHYFGVDVVADLVEANLQKNLPLNHFFRAGDLTTEILPRADAILCRDCLVHFPLETAQKTINLFKQSGSTYLITTTFPRHDYNIQAAMGSWRPLNLQQSPFDFPSPIEMIAERALNPEDKYNDKALGVWLLSDIPSY
jgi:hypothetical protein